MFSRNRFNGQHGAGVPPTGGAKSKAHPPKKRAPNPRVALVIRGKIHRLLQGSADHRVPDSDSYYSEQEEEREARDGRKELRSVYPKVSPRVEAFPPTVSIIKRHAAGSEPSCVGHVELNREGCLRIPCTVKHESCRASSQKRISFESGLREAPEPVQPLPPYSPEVNGTRFAPGGHEFASPRSRPKRPYSAGDCLDFSRALPNTLLEEDEDKEEASSAVIDHILKELRGINKIQEEISDLRDYLTSVRGSVEEVSSCVDAVLLEIEGIRSSNKGVSGTWSGKGCKDGPSARRRPASAYGSLGTAVSKSGSHYFPPVRPEHEELLRTRTDKGTSQLPVSVDHQELEELDDTSDHSSDIPDGATARTLSFGFLEQQDGQDCLSTSSLSSGHSSKSESDLDRLLSSHVRKEQGLRDGKGIWTNTVPPQTRGPVWHGETSYLRDGDLEGDDSESTLYCEGAGSWDHCRGAGGFGTQLQSSKESSEHLSISSGKHYNSPASSSSREEWQSHKRRPQSRQSVHDVTGAKLDNSSVGYSTDISYPQSSGYYSVDGHCGQEFDFEETNDLSYTTNCETETYSVYEESSAVTWTDTSLSTSGDNMERTFPPKIDQSLRNPLPPHPGGAEFQADGFTVKRFGRAVLDFSSALRGALRKLEAPGAVNPEEQTDFELSEPPGLRSMEWQSNPLSYEANIKQQSGATQRRGVTTYGYAFEEFPKLDKSHTFSTVPVLKETCNSLKLESMKVCQSLDMMSPCPEVFTVWPDTSVPDGLLHRPAENSTEEPTKVPEGADLEAQPSQHTTAESLSTTVLVEESVAAGEAGLVEVPRQPAADVPADPEVKPEEDEAEPSQLDEYKLKCVRTFQETLREKRESRRSLVSMSTFSQDDSEQGSQGRILSCMVFLMWVLFVNFSLRFKKDTNSFCDVTSLV